jgi:hypothetical protein
MKPYATVCDACNGAGYINGEQCWKCEGNERLAIGEAMHARPERGARIVAWVAVILLVLVAAYLIGHGGK